VADMVADIPSWRRPVKLLTDAKALIDQMCKAGKIKSKFYKQIIIALL